MQVGKGSEDDQNVENLMTLAAHVKLARKQPLWKVHSVEYPARNIKEAAEPPVHQFHRCVGFGVPECVFGEVDYVVKGSGCA